MQIQMRHRMRHRQPRVFVEVVGVQLDDVFIPQDRLRAVRQRFALDAPVGPSFNQIPERVISGCPVLCLWLEGHPSWVSFCGLSVWLLDQANVVDGTPYPH
jgi:hypothetical protein